MTEANLSVAYTAVKGQELATSVVFYNFDEVGQNEVERIVEDMTHTGTSWYPRLNL